MLSKRLVRGLQEQNLTTGEHVVSFGEDILTSPECLAIDDNGFVYVCDHRSRLVIFYLTL